jgi:hypothetical protein
MSVPLSELLGERERGLRHLLAGFDLLELGQERLCHPD